MSNYTQNVGYPVLTPSYGIGSYGRTGPALLIGSPRNKIGSQNRIYTWMKNHGEGPQYFSFLQKIIGPIPPNRNNYI